MRNNLFWVIYFSITEVKYLNFKASFICFLLVIAFLCFSPAIVPINSFCIDRL